jgi:hypothetical protein
MTASVPGTYLPTTAFAGTFLAQSIGYVQGFLIQDPVSRYFIMGGVLANTETLPMWGGVGVSAATSPVTGTNPPDPSLGQLITRASQIATGTGSLDGFSVFDQAYGMSITAASPVPLTPSYGQVNWVPLGTDARLCVAVSSNFASFEGNPINQQVSWDFVNQQLINYVPAYAAQNFTSATYTSATGVIAITFGTAPFGASAGDLYDGTIVTVSGMSGAGNAPLNGSWPVKTTGTSGTVVSLSGPTGLGVITITGGALLAGGGLLPVKVLEIIPSNCITVSYNSTTNIATWSYNNPLALIMI